MVKIFQITAAFVVAVWVIAVVLSVLGPSRPITDADRARVQHEGFCKAIDGIWDSATGSCS